MFNFYQCMWFTLNLLSVQAIGADDDEDEDDETQFDDPANKKGRGKGKKKRFDEDDEEEPKKKKKKGNRKLVKKMKKLMSVVVEYQDADGRVLSEPFYKLPSRKELPDYYDIIRYPKLRRYRWHRG